MTVLAPPRSRDPRPFASVRRAALVAMTATALSGAMAGGAQAASSPGSTTANVVVQSAITLTGLTPSFTLTGIPNQTYDTAAQNQTVHYTVTTNNAAGYAVTVTPAANTLVGSTGNSNTIPVTALGVSVNGATGYTPFTSSTTPVTVYTKASPSASTGDPLTSDFQVAIPFVKNDTYTGVLNYVATTL